MAKRTSSKTRIKTPPKPEDYSSFVGTVHLQQIVLDSASVSLDRQKLTQSLEDNEKPVKNQIAVKFDTDTSDPLGFRVGFDCSIEGKSDEEVVLSIACKFSAYFRLDKPADPAHLARFAGAEARIVHWPFFRQFVTDISSRMGIPILTVPLTSELFRAE